MLCNYLDFCLSSHTSFPCISSTRLLPPPLEQVDEIWSILRCEAELDVKEEPLLQSFYQSSVLSHPSLESALSSHLAAKLGGDGIAQVFILAMESNPEIGRAVRRDLKAVMERYPACSRMVHCFLYSKGFLALQTHRVAHHLWLEGRKVMALFLQGRASEAFAVDVHPGARVGSGVVLDHATGVVIGEMAVVGDDVSISHNVTLGGTGKEEGDRHPKIGNGVMVGAGTQVLGNVRVGEGAKIGAGSVVLKEVPAWTTVVGSPARAVKTGGADADQPSWSDYVI